MRPHAIRAIQTRQADRQREAASPAPRSTATDDPRGSMKQTLRRADWTLLTLAAADGEPFTPTQLQKSAFLFNLAVTKSTGERIRNFTFSGYGAYDSSLYRDAEALEAEGLASIDRSGPWATYSATRAGIERALDSASHIPTRLLDDLYAVVKWVRGMSFRDLARST